MNTVNDKSRPKVFCLCTPALRCRPKYRFMGMFEGSQNEKRTTSQFSFKFFYRKTSSDWPTNESVQNHPDLSFRLHLYRCFVSRSMHFLVTCFRVYALLYFRQRIRRVRPLRSFQCSDEYAL